MQTLQYKWGVSVAHSHTHFLIPYSLKTKEHTLIFKLLTLHDGHLTFLSWQNKTPHVPFSHRAAGREHQINHLIYRSNR